MAVPVATHLPLPAALWPSGPESAREAHLLGAEKPPPGPAFPQRRAPLALAGAATRLNHPALHIKSPLCARGTLGRPGSLPAALGHMLVGVPFLSRHAPRVRRSTVSRLHRQGRFDFGVADTLFQLLKV